MPAASQRLIYQRDMFSNVLSGCAYVAIARRAGGAGTNSSGLCQTYNVSISRMFAGRPKILCVHYNTQPHMSHFRELQRVLRDGTGRIWLAKVEDGTKAE
jgi:hypothetical protein